MKIDIFNIKEFIDLNNLQEITSPILFQKGDIPHPNGLVSNEIFGVTTKSRKETYAYINLHGNFFHPHVYKAIRRMFRNIDKIVNGEMYYIINENGNLIPDDNGETGIDFLYDNWEKIKWDKQNEETKGARLERMTLLDNCKKDEIFMRYQIVIPAFYRDIKTGGKSKGGETGDINNMYSKLIRLSSLIENQGMFDFQFHSTNYNIQTIIIEIYDYFKVKLAKKRGLIRKYLMGKNVDYCTRTVITNPSFHADRPEDLFTNILYTSIPISQVCSLAYPFVVQYVKSFFEREVIDSKNAKIFYDPEKDEVNKTVQIKDPEAYFSDKYIKKMIDTFIKDPESRFTKIEVPTNTNKTMYLTLTGRRMNASTTAEISGTVSRPMTWTDLLYLACEKVTRDKHCLITRYPVLDEFGVFVSKIRVSSTINTTPMVINGELYKWYPDIDLDLKSNEIPSAFVDSCQFSNSYLEGLEGDYDGDQVTVKILFTQEANEECNRVINDKSFIINSGGKSIRVISKEALQSFYMLTKDPDQNSKSLSTEEKKYFLSLEKKDLTFSNMIKWFADTVDLTKQSKGSKQVKSKYNCNDIVTILPNEYKLIKTDKPVKTTLGRLIFSKVMIESLGFEDIVSYQNKVLVAGEFKKFDATIGEALKEDKITNQQMFEYVDTRDWFGLQLHGLITTSFTRKVISLPPEIKKLKKELFAKYKTDIENNDEKVFEKIEQELIEATKKAYAGDPGLDLYISGARGSIDNHLKNIMLTRGANKNPATHKYEIIQNSLMDGLEKKDITTHSNIITAGSFPKAVY